MSKVIAVLGAGTGLGESVARRFGREGFRVALVARRRDRLDALAERLATDGIEAHVFPADLSDPMAVAALIADIRAGLGRIDVIEYGPIGGDQTHTPATELDARTLAQLVGLLLLSPIEVVRAVLPEWLERGDGSLLLTHGHLAVQPQPYASGPGPLMAAARNYASSLHGELAGTGVYIGTLAIGAYIAGSEIAEAAQATTDPALPVADPDDLADHYWTMYTDRGPFERVHPEHPGLHPAAR